MEENTFRVTFKGVRGSIPSPSSPASIQEKIIHALKQATPEDLKDDASVSSFVESLPAHVKGCYGGNSSCVLIEAGGHKLIFDAGTGIRDLGKRWMDCEFGRGEGEAHLFFSHTHWDHIMGIPFFIPLYVPGNQFTFYSAHENLKERLVGQQQFQYFPVPFSSLSASINFVDLGEYKEYSIGDIKVSWKEMYHPGKSFAYRLDFQGKSFVFATDAEYKQLGMDNLSPTIEFFKDADLLVFDSQYTFIEGMEKEDWGHSSTFIGVDIALEANVKRIAFYHHEPTYSDFKLADILQRTEKYLKVISPDSSLHMFHAQEGLTLDLLE